MVNYREIKKPPLKRDGLFSVVPPSFRKFRDLAKQTALVSRIDIRRVPVTGASVRAYGKFRRGFSGRILLLASTAGSQPIAGSLSEETEGQRVPVNEFIFCYTLPVEGCQSEYSAVPKEMHVR